MFVLSDRRLRSTVLDLACTVGHTECMDEVGKIFKKWICDSNDTRPHPDIRQLIYYYGLSTDLIIDPFFCLALLQLLIPHFSLGMYHVGDETYWDIMFQRFVKETDSSEKLKLMNGLAGIRSSWILSKLVSQLSAILYTYLTFCSRSDISLFSSLLFNTFISFLILRFYQL